MISLLLPVTDCCHSHACRTRVATRPALGQSGFEPTAQLGVQITTNDVIFRRPDRVSDRAECFLFTSFSDAILKAAFDVGFSANWDANVARKFC